MPHYPSNYYGMSTNNTFNNDVTRRLAVKDLVAFATSSRFGGQYMEAKGMPAPYQGTVMDAVAACQQMVNELNMAQTLMPDLGNPVLLGVVGVATNSFGVGVSYAGGISTTVTYDGVGLSTGLRILFYGLSTAALNGVYTVSAAPYSLSRANDLTYYWQFVKPKVFLAQQGTVNKGSVYALVTDSFEVGPTFSVALGTTLAATAAGLTGSSIGFALSNYSPGITTTTSLIYPGYNPNSVLNTGEYDFIAQDSLAKFTYLKNRAHRMAYWIFKLRENYSPAVSSYQTNVVQTIGLANTLNNIGFSTLNNLPSQSRYPSSFNRGF